MHKYLSCPSYVFELMEWHSSNTGSLYNFLSIHYLYSPVKNAFLTGNFWPAISVGDACRGGGCRSPWETRYCSRLTRAAQESAQVWRWTTLLEQRSSKSGWDWRRRRIQIRGNRKKWFKCRQENEERWWQIEIMGGWRLRKEWHNEKISADWH